MSFTILKKTKLITFGCFKTLNVFIVKSLYLHQILSSKLLTEKTFLCPNKNNLIDYLKLNEDEFYLEFFLVY